MTTENEADRPKPDTKRQPTTNVDDFSMSPSERREYLRELTSTGSNMAGVEHVENLLSQDLVLGNIKNADRIEIKHLARMWQHIIEPMHPPKESEIQGMYRAALLDDPDEDYRALSEEEILSLEQNLQVVVNARASRSEGGFQQEKISEQRQVQRLEDERSNPEDREKKTLGQRVAGVFS